MASRASASAALLLSLNLVFFIMLTSVPSSSATCFKNALRLDACANVLNLVDLTVGEPPKPCCKLLGDLVRLEARACLCTSLKLKLLDILKLEIPNLQLNLLLSKCNTGIRCPK
ncbi:14 kDa proline-rich protein DC2.15 [Melia azedarach]|uniref:14 kDa proline-rich protein DC2.15 n=1 Tax=Melia azedarach TaxID=155640 RepID=A0ACC1X1Y0_MELAZ|nr:14 kDa proline-rich protein DC2.15 [Melia azedarach]